MSLLFAAQCSHDLVVEAELYPCSIHIIYCTVYYRLLHEYISLQPSAVPLCIGEPSVRRSVRVPASIPVELPLCRGGSKQPFRVL